ncbi:MAG: hypothetical protein B1H08_01850 [Candidatus Omnitrophica bacterium 4484_171]|nr:MAG: hypothetical protein B1H08_01850 [Candidatus Omnitrophica bacterium 4484_171]
MEIVGFPAGLKYIGVEGIFLSEIPVSSPAPAVLELLKGKNVRMLSLGYESITPRAALLLKRVHYGAVVKWQISKFWQKLVLIFQGFFMPEVNKKAILQQRHYRSLQ